MKAGNLRPAIVKQLPVDPITALSRNHRITTRSLLEHDTSTPAVVPVSASLSPGWQEVFDATVSDLEKALVLALVAADLPVPVIGYETDDGDVVDLAWDNPRIGVLFEPDDELARTMSESGWILCPLDAEQIAAAMKNGVS